MMNFKVSGYIEQTGRTGIRPVPHNATVCIDLGGAQTSPLQ